MRPKNFKNPGKIVKIMSEIPESKARKRRKNEIFCSQKNEKIARKIPKNAKKISKSVIKFAFKLSLIIIRKI